VLGRQKVQIRRPRVRAHGEEVALPTFQALAGTDPLNRRVVEQMLVGVAARQYWRSRALDTLDLVALLIDGVYIVSESLGRPAKSRVARDLESFRAICRNRAA
jgi:hypothetical protein